MKLVYQAQKGKRVNYGFVGIECTLNGYGLWYNYEEKGWFYDKSECKDGKYEWATTMIECSSVRAFRRFVRKHKTTLGGTPIPASAFVLLSRWVGYDVMMRGSK
jgi:hypothetical protein